MSGNIWFTVDSRLEGTVLQIFEKMNVKVDSQNVEACHWLKSNKSSKDADKISEIK